MSFAFSPTEPASPPNALIDAGAFWGAIDINGFRDIMRVGNSDVPHERLKDALLTAVIDVSDELSDWRTTQISAGHLSLAAVPSELFEGKTRLQRLFVKAVYANAAAALIEARRDSSATVEGRNIETAILPAADDFKRDATKAIRAIKGRRGIRAALL